MKKIKNSRGRKAYNSDKADTICMHDYKNAIQIGNVDYVCPVLIPSNSMGLKVDE